MSSIDRIDWHYLGEGFPKDAPQENGGTHIGMYLAWIIKNDLVGEFHLTESKVGVEAVKMKKVTGRTFLIDECDSKLWDEDLSDVGLEFTHFYYGDENGMRLYIYDYAEMFIKEPMSFFDVEDTWENYDRIRPVIDERFRSWQAVRKLYDQQKT